MIQIRFFALFLVVITIVVGLVVSSTSRSNISAQQQQPQQQQNGGNALALVIQYQYVVQTDIPFDSKQLMTEIFSKTSQPADSTFTVLSRSLAPTTAGTSSLATATYILKVELDVYSVYNGILTQAWLVVTNSTAGSTEIDFLGNTVKIVGLSPATDAPAVDARYPGESLGVATIVTVAIVGGFLAIFIFGMIKYNRADNKTMEAMWNEKVLSETRDNTNNNNNNANVRNNVSFQSENLLSEGQLEIISQRPPPSSTNNNAAATVSNFARSTTSADVNSQPDLNAKNIQHDDIPDL